MKLMNFGLVVWGLLSLASVAIGQSKDGMITGFVTDRFGAVIPEVRIEAKNKKGEVFKTKTDFDGNYSLQLPAGRYKIKFDKPPCNIVDIPDYQVPFSGKMALDVSLPCDDTPIVNSSAKRTKLRT
jgi:hypothetical protein